MFALVILLALCVAVLGVAGLIAVVLVAGVVLYALTRPPPQPAPEPIDVPVLARLLVLRAFIVGRQAGRHRENKLRSVAVIRLEDPELPSANAVPDVLLRGVFYALVLEELDRRTAQTSRRRPAKKLGARLGADDPYPLYAAMVAATTTEGEPGTAPRPWLRSVNVLDDATAAARTLGLTAEDLERYHPFLFELPLQRWR